MTAKTYSCPKCGREATTGRWKNIFLLVLCGSLLLPFGGCEDTSDRGAEEAPPRLDLSDATNIVADLQRRQLFGLTVGKPVPRGCQGLVGGKCDRFAAWTFKIEKGAGGSKLACRDLTLPTDDGNALLDHGYAVMDRRTGVVVALLARVSRSPGNYDKLLEELFRAFGGCETKLGADIWQSGDIYQTAFFVDGDFVVELNHHTQFGDELLLRKADATGMRPRSFVDIVKDWRESSLIPVPSEHPAKVLYDKYTRR